MHRRNWVVCPWVRVHSQVDFLWGWNGVVACPFVELEAHQVELAHHAQKTGSFEIRLFGSNDVHTLKGASANVGEISATEARKERAPFGDCFALGSIGSSAPAFAFAPGVDSAGIRVVHEI